MRRAFLGSCLATAAILCGGGAALAQAPPPPTAANGATVKAIATDIPTPTSISFGSDGTVFVGANGPESGGPPHSPTATAAATKGGVYAVKGGTTTRVPKSPKVVFGVVWHKGILYVTSPNTIYAFSGWNGTKFAKRRVVYSQTQSGFPGFNGIVYGPDGRLYVGVSLTEDGKSTKGGNRVLSLRPDGTNVKVFARGIRQPWQFTFVKGIADPFGTNLGQDDLGPSQPPDYIMRLKKGQNYGFAKCNWVDATKCAKFAKPLWLLPPHSSPMGIGAIGSTLYVALFGGLSGGNNPEVVSLSSTGTGEIKPVLTGFVAPVVALGIRKGRLYVGDLTGTVWRVKV